ncbi:hypothetical protein DSO57_1008113 [Entomophthora muscae]|uniref:Uncharacterized protein n=1 Tax=Entomophthora muscae TaxID=34485 RepID=A0ACC2TUP6_9FUNG|nr:hypothetical protein DSO57_1008113 [Entomophthora muscae]
MPETIAKPSNLLNYPLQNFSSVQSNSSTGSVGVLTVPYITCCPLASGFPFKVPIVNVPPTILSTRRRVQIPLCTFLHQKIHLVCLVSDSVLLASPGKTSYSPGTFKNASITLKFVAFTLAPVLVIIWSTSPDLWGCLSSLAFYVGEDPLHLLHLLEDLPRHDQDLVATGKKLAKSLTCDYLVFSSPNYDHIVPSETGNPVDPPPLEVEFITPKVKFSPNNFPPSSTPWLCDGMSLMVLDSYFPQLSPVFSLWTPV